MKVISGMNLFLDILRVVNATLVFVEKSANQMNDGDALYPIAKVLCTTNFFYLKPNQFVAVKILTPALYDVSVCYDFSEFVSSLIALITITFVLFSWSRIAKFDTQAWTFLNILEMVVGNGNVRYPISKSEIICFASVIIVGFFFGVDLISGLTSVMIMQEKERSIETLADLKSNNLTIVTVFDVKLEENRISNQFYKDIQKINIKNFYLKELYQRAGPYKGTIAVSKVMRDVLIAKNTSVTTLAFEVDAVMIPDLVVVNNKVQARIINLVELVMIHGWQL